jgi:hypothetical protein
MTYSTSLYTDTFRFLSYSYLSSSSSSLLPPRGPAKGVILPYFLLALTDSMPFCPTGSGPKSAPFYPYFPLPRMGLYPTLIIPVLSRIYVYFLAPVRPEDGSNMTLRNVGILPYYVTSQYRDVVLRRCKKKTNLAFI